MTHLFESSRAPLLALAVVCTPLQNWVVSRVKYPTGPGGMPFCAQLAEPLFA